MLVYGECECFVMQMLYVCVLCASCGSSQCCVLHDLQFVNSGTSPCLYTMHMIIKFSDLCHYCYFSVPLANIISYIRILLCIN